MQIGGRTKKPYHFGPYTFPQMLGWVWRNLTGPSRSNPANVIFAERTATWNDISHEITLGVGGDVMMMFGKELLLDEVFQQFFSDCDYLLLNMEGVITDRPKKGPDQKHTPEIIPTLESLFPATNTFLSLANNHSADFGLKECLKSKQLFEQFGFRCFGLKDSPYVDLHPGLRVVAATQWSNRPDNGLLSWLDADLATLRRKDCFNLLFPHWSYEMQCYPPNWSVHQMHSWLGIFDGVVGHHSHTPQPFSMYNMNGINKLAGYSLGDFCFGLGYKQWPSLKHYPYGIVAKFSIGRLNKNPQHWAVGEVSWSFTDCSVIRRPGTDIRFILSICQNLPYFNVPE
jgi:hypothetical protein